MRILLGFVALTGLLWLSLPQQAQAFATCSPYCPSLIHPCCCPSPCPVSDNQSISDIADELSSTSQYLKMLGAVGSPQKFTAGSALQVAAGSGLGGAYSQNLSSLAGVVSPTPRTSIEAELSPAIGLASTQLPGPYQQLASSASNGSFSSVRSALSSQLYPNSPLSAVAAGAFAAGSTKNAATASVNSYSSVQVSRKTLASLGPEVAAIQQRADASQSLRDDWKVNSAARTLLARRMVEVAKLLASALDASGYAIVGRQYPTPQAPPISVSVPGPSGPTPDQASWLQMMAAAQTVQSNLNAAVAAHNAAAGQAALSAQEASLLEVVQAQEGAKAQMFSMMQTVIGALGTLYVDPASAWRRLSADLASLDQATYVSGGARLGVGATVAGQLASALEAQTATTAYGARVSDQTCDPNAFNSDGSQVQCNPFTVAPASLYDAAATLAGQSGAAMSDPIGLCAQAGPNCIAAVTLNSDGSSQPNDPLFVALQVYLELDKRKEYLDDLRRGSPDDLLVPTSSLFNELATYAPSCLTGPMPPTAQNIVNYATFFDVAPGCPHTTWQSGPLAGQPIDHTALGGVDETLWLMNASRAKYQATYGSGPTEAQLIAAASTTAQQSNLASLAQRFGRPDLQATVNSLGTVSGAIANDPGHSTVIHY